mmetsp:Transcript_9727/g.23800  ORF Transcript_9727/g.23800 Transcript_9727/m.23800 type:complete len:252 (-) Transcript_9727:341-1096(-)
MDSDEELVASASIDLVKSARPDAAIRSVIVRYVDVDASSATCPMAWPETAMRERRSMFAIRFSACSTAAVSARRPASFDPTSSISGWSFDAPTSDTLCAPGRSPSAADAPGSCRALLLCPAAGNTTISDRSDRRSWSRERRVERAETAPRSVPRAFFIRSETAVICATLPPAMIRTSTSVPVREMRSMALLADAKESSSATPHVAQMVARHCTPAPIVMGCSAVRNAESTLSITAARTPVLYCIVAVASVP